MIIPSFLVTINSALPSDLATVSKFDPEVLASLDPIIKPDGDDSLIVK
jgi:hypothetical protein